MSLWKACTFGLRIATFAVLAGLPVTAAAQNREADDQAFREFEQIVADFSGQERIEAWEAFLQKYPQSTAVPKVKDILSELKGEKPRAVAAPTPYTKDPDLDFLNEASPTPTPRPVATAAPIAITRPTPTPRPQRSNTSNSFLDGSDSDGGGGGNGGTRVASRPESFSSSRPPSGPPRGSQGRSRRGDGVGKPSHTEISVFAGFAPDETYVRNILVGVSATQRFGRTYGVMLEGYGVSSSETALLGSLRDLDAEPEVITKYNFLAGASLEANVLSAIDPITGQIPGRNDLYLRLGGGIVNSDVEICKQEGTQKCAEPLFIDGVNFSYLAAGVGHRFYVTRWMTLRSEVRGRVVFELIDGEVTPRSNIQINIGPSFVF